MSTIQTGHFKQALYAILDETFDDVKGIYLDKGTSFIADQTEFASPYEVGGAIGALVHTAYNLDKIRQALCTIK